MDNNKYLKAIAKTNEYVLAIVILLGALGIRLVIAPTDFGLAFITFYPASVLCFFLCGNSAGALFVVLSSIVGYYIFTPPFWGWDYSFKGYLSLVGYVCSAVITAYLIHLIKITKNKYLSLLESQTDLICRTDTQGRILFANKAYAKYFGKSPADLIRNKWKPAIHAQDVELVNSQLALLSKALPVIEVEFRVTLDDHDVRWMHFINSACFDELGEISGIQSVGRDITEKKMLEMQLERYAAEIDDLYEHSPCGYHSLSKDGTVLKINNTALSWLGYNRDEVIGKLKFKDFLTEESIETFNHHFPEFLASGHVSNLSFDWRCKNGDIRSVLLTATAVFDNDGTYLFSRSVAYDNTKLKAAERQLEKLAEEQQLILDNELVGTLRVSNRKILWCNKGMETIFGYDENELIGSDTRLLFLDNQSYEAIGSAAHQTLNDHGMYRSQVELIRKDGQTFWVDLSGKLLPDDESLWMILDITEIKRHQDEIQYVAYHDILTGLPNRLLFSDRLNQAIEQTKRNNKYLAVCYLDLDNFKPVNDSYGHAAGDALLIEVVRRMKISVRSIDTVCRVGGDEFVILLTALEGTDEYQSILKRMLEEIAIPIILSGGSSIKVSASVGVSLFPLDSEVPDMLVRFADEAMYQAKSTGRNGIKIYSELNSHN